MPSPADSSRDSEADSVRPILDLTMGDLTMRAHAAMAPTWREMAGRMSPRTEAEGTAKRGYVRCADSNATTQHG